jgi:hypothetical protein
MSDFREALRSELVAAAGRPLPRRQLPPRPVLLRAGALAVAAVAVALAIFVLPWGAQHAPPEPAVQPPGVTGQPLFGGTLEPGVRYASRHLVPTVSFVASGLPWMAGGTQSPLLLQLIASGKGFQMPKLNRPALSLSFARLPQVVDPKTDNVLPAPKDLVGWLRAHPDLRAGTPARVTLAGRAATRLDFTVVAHPSREDPFCRSRFQFSCALLGPDASIKAGSAVRLFVVPGRPDPLLVSLISSDPSQLGRLIKGSESLLASLRIGR